MEKLKLTIRKLLKGLQLLQNMVLSVLIEFKKLIIPKVHNLLSIMKKLDHKCHMLVTIRKHII